MTKNESHQKICCITGRRPSGFPWTYGDNMHTAVYKQRLRQVLALLIEQEGISHFLSGGAQGVDLDAAESVLSLRENHPTLVHTLVLPYENQGGRYALTDKKRHEGVQSSSLVVCVGQEYTPWCMQRRNEYMVDAADLVIAVVSGEKKGGTFNTVRYAKRKQVPVYLFDLADCLTLSAEDWLQKAKNYESKQLEII